MFAEEERGRDRAVGDASQETSAAAAAASAAATAVSSLNPLAETGGDANNAKGGLGGTGGEVVGDPGLGVRSGFSVGDVDVDVDADVGVEERGGSSGGKKQAAAGGLEKQPPGPSEKKTEQFEWVAIPGGRETPPEFDKNGEEVADEAVSMGGAMRTGGASNGYEGAGSARGGAGGAAVSMAEPSGQEEAVATSAGAAWREASGGISVSPPAPPVASRAGAVSVLSPTAATTAATTAAREVGVSTDELDMPRAAPAAAAAGSAPAVIGAEPSGGCGGTITVDFSSGSGSPAGDEGIEWQRARAILDDMVAADHLPPPPAEAFQAVLGACDAAGSVEEALEVASAMVGAGYSPSKRLVARLMASHADVLDRERREMEEAAAAPAEDWGGGL